jgi:hypothetical protein
VRIPLHIAFDDRWRPEEVFQVTDKENGGQSAFS